MGPVPGEIVGVSDRPRRLRAAHPVPAASLLAHALADARGAGPARCCRVLPDLAGIWLSTRRRGRGAVTLTPYARAEFGSPSPATTCPAAGDRRSNVGSPRAASLRIR